MSITVTLPPGADVHDWEHRLGGTVYYSFSLEDLGVWYAVLYEDRSYRAITIDTKLEESLTNEQLFDLLANATLRNPLPRGTRPELELVTEDDVERLGKS